MFCSMAKIDNPTSCDMIVYSTLMCFHPLDILQVCLKHIEASWMGSHRVKILIDWVMAKVQGKPRRKVEV
jgi:hypothetical protein